MSLCQHSIARSSEPSLCVGRHLRRAYVFSRSSDANRLTRYIPAALLLNPSVSPVRRVKYTEGSAHGSVFISALRADIHQGLEQWVMRL
ncbi:hypothetical protein MHYP_G00207880 [Metynnis hypsauchen]